MGWFFFFPARESTKPPKMPARLGFARGRRAPAPGEVWRAMLGLQHGLAWPQPAPQHGPPRSRLAARLEKSSLQRTMRAAGPRGRPAQWGCTQWGRGLAPEGTRGRSSPAPEQKCSITGLLGHRWHRAEVGVMGRGILPRLPPSESSPLNLTFKNAKARNLLYSH